MPGPSRLLTVAYCIIGLIVAANHDYLVRLDTLKRIASGLLGILLWPLVLLGVDLRIT
jgi:hypothetical protein